jgi:hypothetical protein
MKRKSKAKKDNFGSDIAKAILKVGKKHKLCNERAVKEAFGLLAFIIQQNDGSREVQILLNEFLN